MVQALQTSPPFHDNEVDIDLGEIGRTVSRQWRKVAIITALATVFAVCYVLFARPQFTVDGSLYLGDAQSGGNAAQALSSGPNFLSDFQSVSDVETQIELIQSKALLEQAILETGLNSPITREGTPQLNFWKWRLFHGKAIAAFGPNPGDIEALFATFAAPVSQTATFTVVVGDGGSYRIIEPQGWGFAKKTVLTGVLGQPASGGGLSLLMKPAIDGALPATGSRFVLKVSPVETVFTNLSSSGALSVSAGGTVTEPTKVANIEFQWDNPYTARRLVDQLMRDFIATQLAWKTESASTMQNFVANQLNNVRASLTNADQNLAKYQSQTGILDVPENARSLIDRLSNYEVQRTSALLQQAALRQLSTEIAHPSKSLNPYLVSQTNDPVLGLLAGQLASAETQLQALSTQFTDNTTEVQIQAASVAKIEDSIRTLVNNNLAMANGNLANIDRLVAQFEAQIKTMPSESLQVISLTRASDVFGQLYVLLMEKGEEAEVAKAATIVNTRIVTPAEIPLTATKPKATTTVLLGMLLGLFAGVAAVLGQRALSGRFQSDDEIRRLVPLPVYGFLPLQSRNEIATGIFAIHQQTPFAEAFRLLRSNLYQSTISQSLRVVAITSATIADGKTTVAANLAKILAADGKDVILVDGDLGRGSLHEVLKINQAPGLTEWLITGVQPKFQKVAEQRFVVLSAGVAPPNPSELLNVPRLSEIIEVLRASFDFVIVDCPPLPAVSDSMTLGRLADIILSVVRVENTPRRSFAMHNETLGALDRRHGMIINGVSGSSYGYGYGYSEKFPGLTMLEGGRVGIEGIWRRFR
jgi:tyrosine-protein kinase Etk/Wzc